MSKEKYICKRCGTEYPKKTQLYKGVCKDCIWKGY